MAPRPGDVLVIKDPPETTPSRCRCDSLLLPMPGPSKNLTTVFCMPCGRWLHYVKGVWVPSRRRGPYTHPQTRELMKYLLKCRRSGIAEEQINDIYPKVWDMTARMFGVKVLRVPDLPTAQRINDDDH